VNLDRSLDPTVLRPLPLPVPAVPAFGNHPTPPIVVQAPPRSPFGGIAHKADPPPTARHRQQPPLPSRRPRPRPPPWARWASTRSRRLSRGRVGGRRAPAPRPACRALHHRVLSPRRALQRRRARRAPQRRRRLGRGARAALRHRQGPTDGARRRGPGVRRARRCPAAPLGALLQDVVDVLPGHDFASVRDLQVLSSCFDK
jgi:hypothetical protein